MIQCYDGCDHTAVSTQISSLRFSSQLSLEDNPQRYTQQAACQKRCRIDGVLEVLTRARQAAQQVVDRSQSSCDSAEEHNQGPGAKKELLKVGKL